MIICALCDNEYAPQPMAAGIRSLAPPLSGDIRYPSVPLPSGVVSAAAVSAGASATVSFGS